MNVYLDTSVILSHLLSQPNRLPNWGAWAACYTSTLTRVEFLRTVDRLRLGGALTDEERVALQEQFAIVWDASYRVALSQEIMDRTCSPMPTVLGTLDAIHLVSALHVTTSHHLDLTFVTHDEQLATGARAAGLPVAGV